MKVLLIANSKVVFGRELQTQLVQRNINAALLDFEFLSLVDSDQNNDFKYSNLFNKFRKIPKLSMFFRMWYIKKVIQDNRFDVINIHISRWPYLMILPWLTRRRFVITFYGSDFYRTSDFTKKIQINLYKQADALTFTNPNTKKSFLEYYKKFQSKSYVCRFGLQTLNFINKNKNKDRQEIKKDLGYSTDKIIITCGYNSTKEQQHDIMIDSICKLPKNVLNSAQFIFPMTYGDTAHKEKVKLKLNSMNFDYIVLEDFLYTDKNANIKLASDIMINILETDSFSGSMQEFLYANNVVITGNWLPYQVFDDAGVEYIKIDNINELSRTLERAISSGSKLFDTTKNTKIISDLSLWDNTIEKWISVYEN